MTYTPVIYDWPRGLVPSSQMFTAGAQSVSGGMTLGGVSIENPEPGGRAVLNMAFAPFRRVENVNASWVATRVMAGAVMRVALTTTAQLLPADQIFGAAADHFVEMDDPFSALPITIWAPSVPLTAVAAKGSTNVVADLSDLGPVLRPGHVIGFKTGDYDFAHMIMAISYDGGDQATIMVAPPLRRAREIGDALFLRPAMLATCVNPKELAGTFLQGRTMQFGAGSFVEALV